MAFVRLPVMIVQAYYSYSSAGALWGNCTVSQFFVLNTSIASIHLLDFVMITICNIHVPFVKSVVDYRRRQNKTLITHTHPLFLVMLMAKEEWIVSLHLWAMHKSGVASECLLSLGNNTSACFHTFAIGLTNLGYFIVCLLIKTKCLKRYEIKRFYKI